MTLNSISQPRSDKSDISFISLGVSILVAPNPTNTILDARSAERPLARLEDRLCKVTEDNLSQARAMGSLKRLSPYLEFI